MIMIINKICLVLSESDFFITSTSMNYKNMVPDYIQICVDNVYSSIAVYLGVATREFILDEMVTEF